MKSFKAILTSICLLLTFTSCVGGTEKRADDSQQNSSAATEQKESEPNTGSQETKQPAKLLYMGHASLRITTPENRVIYIDPYAGKGYDAAADLILVTHDHFDHTAVDKITRRAEGCQTVTWKEALVKGNYKTFDFGFATVEAVEAAFAELNVTHHVFAACEFGIGLESSVGPRNGIDMVVALCLYIGHHGHGQSGSCVQLNGAGGDMAGTVRHAQLKEAEGLVGKGLGGVALVEEDDGFVKVFFLLAENAQQLLGLPRRVTFGGGEGLAVVAFGQLCESDTLGIDTLFAQLAGRECGILVLSPQRGDKQ